ESPRPWISSGQPPSGPGGGAHPAEGPSPQEAHPMPADGPLPQNPTAAPADPDPRTARPSWSDRYGARHRMCRVKDFPPGLVGPRKVRIYWRNDHYLLQWWAPAQGKNVSERIVGDLLTALVRARE